MRTESIFFVTIAALVAAGVTVKLSLPPGIDGGPQAKSVYADGVAMPANTKASPGGFLSMP